LLGLVVFSTLAGRNLSAHVKENLIVDGDARPGHDRVGSLVDVQRTAVAAIPSKPALHQQETGTGEATKEMGADPSELPMASTLPLIVELTLRSAYANNDSLLWISKDSRNTQGG
jgi:cell division transport system permease protein